MKFWLTLSISLAMTLALVPVSAQAADGRLNWLMQQAQSAETHDEKQLAYRLAANELRASPELCRDQKTETDEILSALLLADDTSEALGLWHWRRRQQLEEALGDRCLPAELAVEKALTALPEHIAALHIILLPERVELLLHHSGGSEKADVSVPAQRIANIAARYQRAVRSGRSQASRYGERLSQWLLKPLWPTLSSLNPQLLQLHVDERLLALPWAALPVPDKSVLFGDVIPFAVSANSDALTLVGELPRPSLLFGAIESADILASENFEPLPGTAKEWEESRKSVRSRALFDEQLSRQSLSEALEASDFSLLHLASHGEVSAAGQSFVLLGDGRLPIVELGDLVRERRYGEQPLRLVTLSACETAVAAEPNGRRDARLGLAGVALQAGAATALASLWPVDDAATAELMGEFYRAMSRGKNAAQALQQARRKLREIGYDRALFFAGFQLYGSGQ